MTLARFVRRDLWRNPRRTLASLVGVIVGVGLFSAVLFFIDGSGAAMTRRALAPLSLDMQRVLTAPLGGGVRFERKLTDDQLAAGATTRVTLTVTNDGVSPAHEVVVRDRLKEPLTYVPGSTLLDGAVVPDVDGRIPLAQGGPGTGLNIGTVDPKTTRQITYRVTATSGVTTAAGLPADATISSREAPSPARANAPRSVPLPQLAEQIRGLPGVAAADTLAFVDLPGKISANGAELGGPVKLFAFDAGYPARYQSIKMRSGSLRPGGMVISAETARDLNIGEGATVTLELPGGAAPLALPVSGITDLSGAKPLFESREWRRFEKFVYAPHAVVVDPAVYAERVVPAFTAAAAQIDSEITSFPFEELDVSVDRATLNADPGTALVQTLKVAAAVKAVAPGQDYLLDNISNTLAVAEGDAVVAKRMFAFLGLPGAILAAILTAYAGALLAGAQRRESALLRVRGASRRHLMYMLTLRTVALAGRRIGARRGAGLRLGPRAAGPLDPVRSLHRGPRGVGARRGRRRDGGHRARALRAGPTPRHPGDQAGPRLGPGPGPAGLAAADPGVPGAGRSRRRPGGRPAQRRIRRSVRFGVLGAVRVAPAAPVGRPAGRLAGRHHADRPPPAGGDGTQRARPEGARLPPVARRCPVAQHHPAAGRARRRRRHRGARRRARDDARVLRDRLRQGQGVRRAVPGRLRHPPDAEPHESVSRARRGWRPSSWWTAPAAPPPWSSPPRTPS